MRKLLSSLWGRALFATVGIALAVFLACAVYGGREKEAVTSIPQLNRPGRAEAASKGGDAYTSAAQLDGKKIGVLTGSIIDAIVKENLPSAEAVYFDSQANLTTALLSGKIDACIFDEPISMMLSAGDDRLTYVPEYLSHYENAFFLAKDGNAALLEELNGFIRQLKDDGTLAKMQKIWFGADESQKTVAPYETFPAPNGTLELAQGGEFPPFVYMRDNRIVGYDIDILARFCEARGYGLKPMTMNVSSMIPAVQSGRCDLGGGGITITAERAENVTFTEPIYSGGGVPLVRAGNKAGSAASGDTAPKGGETYTSVAQLDGRKIGVKTASIYDGITKENFPSSEAVYFDSQADLIAALLSGKIDAFVNDEPIIMMLAAGDDRLTYIPEYLNRFKNAFFVAKGGNAALLEELNSFIRQLTDDGTLAEMQKIWFGVDESKKVVAPYETFPAPNGTLKFAQDGQSPPFAYMKGNRIVGYDIDVLARFCEARGYGLRPVTMNFSGIIPAVQSGRCDLGGGGVTITTERAESVTFTEPVYSGGGVPMVRAGEKAAGSSFLSGIEAGLASSFEKTFIREGRWRLFVEGVGITLLLTVLSIVFGTALGFAAYLLCRNGNPVANAVTRFCVWLVRGMPMVVLLMILYYVVFGSWDIDGLWVAVIAFTLTFGASMYGMLLGGVGAVDRGQTEAAYALGFTDRRSFFTIILPQAARHFMPSYKAEVVALIKATAIVGYIAVQDLTKMGDIVRSRTYEAFFPLIAVAVIYFILAGALNFLVQRVQNRLDPQRRRREEILRGIDTEAAGPAERRAEDHD